MGELRVLNQQGDVKLEWDPADKESTATARAEFDRLREDGYEMYEVVDAKGKRVTRWNAKAGKLLAAPGARKPRETETGRRPRAMAGGPLGVSARL